jgi:hypothetical protein
MPPIRSAPTAITGSICVRSRADRYARVASVRARRVREWENCVIYTPEAPNLYLLNLNAWLIFELCDGDSLAGIEQRYLAAVEDRLTQGEAREQLDAGLSYLERAGIVTTVPSENSLQGEGS